MIMTGDASIYIINPGLRGYMTEICCSIPKEYEPDEHIWAFRELSWHVVTDGHQVYIRPFLSEEDIAGAGDVSHSQDEQYSLPMAAVVIEWYHGGSKDESDWPQITPANVGGERTT